MEKSEGHPSFWQIAIHTPDHLVAMSILIGSCRRRKEETCHGSWVLKHLKQQTHLKHLITRKRRFKSMRTRRKVDLEAPRYANYPHRAALKTCSLGGVLTSGSTSSRVFTSGSTSSRVLTSGSTSSRPHCGDISRHGQYPLYANCHTANSASIHFLRDVSNSLRKARWDCLRRGASCFLACPSLMSTWNVRVHSH